MRNAHFIRYRVVGLNRNNLLNLLKKNGITLYKIAVKGQKITEFSIEFNEKQKFFAITENLCYNITRIREYGFLYPFISLFKKVGVVIGIAIFTAVVILADKTIFAIDYGGTGALYKADAVELLEEYGVKKYGVITTQTLRKAESGILSSTDKFSFVSLKKQGGRLKVNLVLSKNNQPTLDTARKCLTAPEDGIIESVKAYRGTAIVCVGEKVKAGSVLIDGYNIIKDTKVETFVLGVVTILCEKTFTFYGKEGEEESVILLAKEMVDYDIIDESCEFLSGIYTVRLTCRIKVK